MKMVLTLNGGDGGAGYFRIEYWWHGGGGDS